MLIFLIKKISVTVNIQYCISFRCKQWLDIYIAYEVIYNLFIGLSMLEMLFNLRVPWAEVSSACPPPLWFALNLQSPQAFLLGLL